jgi:hypothetical protein
MAQLLKLHVQQNSSAPNPFAAQQNSYLQKLYKSP